MCDSLSDVPYEVLEAQDVVTEIVKLAFGDLRFTFSFCQVHMEVNTVALTFQ